MYNNCHVSNSLLPNETHRTYNLRPRRHNRTLTSYQNNTVVRMYVCFVSRIQPHSETIVLPSSNSFAYYYVSDYTQMRASPTCVWCQWSSVKTSSSRSCCVIRCCWMRRVSILACASLLQAASLHRPIRLPILAYRSACHGACTARTVAHNK